MKFIFVVVFILSIGVIFSTSAFGAAPALPTAVQVSPFYWSEDGFGIDILRAFELPITPYLTPGVNEQSSKEEIIQAYLEANSDLAAKIIVSDEERGQIFLVHFFEGDIEGVKTYSSFSKFTPENPFTGNYRFELESLPSKENLEYFEFVNKWKLDSHSQLFDVNIDVVSGDGTIIQTWVYPSCKITDYVIYRQGNKDVFGFTRVFDTEFRDKTSFECEGFDLKNEQKQSDLTSSPITPAKYTPDDSQRIQTVAVRFDERILTPSDPPITTFSKFTHFFDVEDIPIDLPVEIPPLQKTGQTFEGKQQFSLESLPNKDNELFYELVNNWITKSFDEPFDVYVDFITGDGTIIQTWLYTQCDITDYRVNLTESLLEYKFTGLFPSEIRDKTDFACRSLVLDFEQKESPISDFIPIKPVKLIPDEKDRAQIFVVHFSNSQLIDETISLTSYSKFSPVSPFDERFQGFSLESLPSKDKHNIYKIINNWIEGSFTEDFDVDIELVSGDGTIIQTWKYSNCDIIDYLAFLNDNLVVYKFNGEIIPEIRDTISFQCGNTILDTNQKASELVGSDVKTVDFVPSQDDSAQRFVLHTLGGVIPETISFDDFAKFVPKSPFDKSNLGFRLESLPHEENQFTYFYINNWKDRESAQEPFEVNVDLVTGDNTVIQTAKFENCKIVDYSTYLNDNLINIRFHQGVNYEIREEIEFGCGDFAFSAEQSQSQTTERFVPDNFQRATNFVVHFSDGLISEPVSLSVPHFVPVNAENLAIPFPGRTFDEKPQFMISTLTQKDLKPLYVGINNWESQKKTLSPFDVDVDVVSGNGNVIHTWKYNDCEPKNFYTTLEHNILFFPFTNQFGSEMRDFALLECRAFYIESPKEVFKKPERETESTELGMIVSPESPYEQLRQGAAPEEIMCKETYELVLRPTNNLPACIKESSLEKFSEKGWKHVPKQEMILEKQAEVISTEFLPPESELADSITVRLSGGMIPEEISLTTFSNFAPLSEKEIGKLSIPNYFFDDTYANFALESLPSKDKQEFYDLVLKWLVATDRESFDVDVDIVALDGDIIQTWEYTTCDITDYRTILDEKLHLIKYHDKYQSEIIDKTVMRCAGLDINPRI